MKLYYRISDQSYPKQKLIGATKEICLMNFCKAFADIIFPQPLPEIPPMKILADRCERKTIKMLTGTGIPITMTDLGNAGSLQKALLLAIEECDDNDIAYFCEDDYLHLPSAPKLLQEGIRRSDYVTLYDHPDKYSRLYNGGEFSKVIRTTSSHWRYTASTCMTFGVKIKTLKEDLDVWKEYTSDQHPHDHQIFTDLGKKGRRLAVCIPGVACHIDLNVSTMLKQMLIEPWAIQLMIDELENQLQLIPGYPLLPEYFEVRKQLVSGKQGAELLMALDALRSHFAK